MPALVDGETVLWDGQPNSNFRFTPATMAACIFAATLLLACLGMATVIERSVPGVYWQILAPGLVLAVAIGVVFFTRDSRQRRATSYRLTTRRTIITTAAGSQSYTLPAPDQIFHTGSAVTFGRDARGRALDFASLDDAATVFDLMRRAAADGMTAAQQHAKDEA